MKRKNLFFISVVCIFLAVAVIGCAPAMSATYAPSYQPVEQPYSAAPTLAAPNGEPYVDNFFDNYGVNPFIDTEDDHLSTFALDVDTGSYTVARRYLSDGNLPDKDSVRVEEFVNYFQQGYDMPSQEDRFSISIDGGSAPFTETGQYRIMRIGVQGYAVAPEDRLNASLTFVIDVSGSMDMENRLELVKRSLNLLVDQLRPQDKVGIVVYGTTAHVLLQPTSAEESHEIQHAINKLKPEGSTNAEDGIRMGYQLAYEAFIPEGINRVILCSDGVANVGQTGADDIWDEVSDYAARGITLTTVGFGMGNFNDVLMEQLADTGDGFYAYVDDIKEAERIFVTNLTSNLQVIGMDARIQVDFNPEVVSRYRLIGFENRAMQDDEFRDDTVDAGELGAGHSVTALYEVKLHPDVKGQIATVYMRWLDPISNEASEIQESFHTSQMVDDFEQASIRFQWDVLVAEYAEVLRESYWAQTTSLNDVYAEVGRVAEILGEDPDAADFEEMVSQTLSLES